MKTDPKYSVEESFVNKELRESIEVQEYIRLYKRLRVMSFMLQYLIPTLFVVIILMS